MHVAHILKTKGAAVATAAPDTTIAETVRLLSKRRIGALVVLAADGAVVGIISERDLVHGLAEHGPRLLEMHVAALMTKKVLSCTPESTMDEVMGVMTARRIRHLPVIAGGKLVGIVSIGDVVKNRLEELAAEGDMLRNYIAGA